MDDYMMQLSNSVNEVLNDVLKNDNGVLVKGIIMHDTSPMFPARRTRRVPTVEHLLSPEKILKSGKATIVFWKDGSKTVVKCGKDESPDDYDAFTAALAIKVFGCNSHLKKVIKNKTVIQQTKKGKE